jgi:hypothetical protein
MVGVLVSSEITVLGGTTNDLNNIVGATIIEFYIRIEMVIQGQ